MNIKSISKHLKAHPRDRVALTDNVYIVNTYTYDKEGTVSKTLSYLTSWAGAQRLMPPIIPSNKSLEPISLNFIVNPLPLSYLSKITSVDFTMQFTV